MAVDPEILKQILGMAGTGGLSAASAMNPYAAIAGAIPQVFQGALGVGQMIKGAKLAKSTQRPWMDVPAAQTEALFNARNMANGQAPGLNTAMQQMAQAQAGSIAGIQNSGGGGAERLAALTMLDQNAGTQAQNLGAMQENYKVNQASNLQNQLMQLADTQQKQFMYNKDEPYRNIMEASKASTDSGIQNLHGSLTGLGGTFAASLTKRPAGDIGSLVDSPAADGSGTVTPSTDPFDPTKVAGQGEGPMNGLPVDSPIAKGPAPKINTSGPGEPIPFMGTTETGENEMPALQRDLKTGNFDPKVYDPKTGKVLPKNSPNSIAAADPNARIFGAKPRFNPNQGMESYDFNSLSGSEMSSPDGNGPKPIGYDANTKETNPVAGPQNYNPMPGEPRDPFPIGYGGGKLAATLGKNANPKLYGSVFNNLMKQLLPIPSSETGQKPTPSDGTFELPSGLMKGYGKSFGGDKEYKKPSVSVNSEQIQIPSRQVPMEDPFATSTSDMKRPREYWFGKDESGNEVMFWRFFDGDKIRKTNAKRSEIDTKGRGVKMVEIANPIASR